jgi:hypothetical protein
MFTTGEKIAFTLTVGSLGLVFFYAFFIALPTTLLAEEKCLADGYPKAHVTWNLKRYCSNLDGSVTVKVEKLK